MDEDEHNRGYDSRKSPKMRGNRATEMRAVNSRYGRALIPIHFSNATSHAMAKNKAVSASMRADLKISHREQTRLIDRLHRTQTELHSKLINLAERQSELAKATELRKQQETKNDPIKERREGKKGGENDNTSENNHLDKQAQPEPPRGDDNRSSDSESQHETGSILPVLLETQSSKISDNIDLDPDSDKGLPSTGIQAGPSAYYKNKNKADNMKSSRENKKLKNNSKVVGQGSNEDPRTSRDLKQRVRKVRFFLPFTSSLDSIQKESKHRITERQNSSDEETHIKGQSTGTMITQFPNTKLTQTNNSACTVNVKNENHKIKEETTTVENNPEAYQLGRSSTLENHGFSSGSDLDLTEEAESSESENVSEISATSSSHTRGKSATSVGSVSSIGIKPTKKPRDNTLVSTSPRFQQFRTAMKTIQKFENNAAALQQSILSEGQDVFPYKANKDGRFEPLLIPYKRRTFPIPRPEAAVRRLHLLEREANYSHEHVEKSDQVQKTVGNPQQKISIMISNNELVEVPHLPDIDAHAQQEEAVNPSRKLSLSTQQYRTYNSRTQRAASVSAPGQFRHSSQNAVPRSTSADNGARNHTDSAIYHLDNIKGGRHSNSACKMSLMSANGNGAGGELANRNGRYSGSANRKVNTTLGHLLNTLDKRLPTRDKEPESILAMRECRYIRIYSPALKLSSAYRRTSSWNMPGTPSGGYSRNRLMPST